MNNRCLPAFLPSGGVAVSQPSCPQVESGGQSCLVEGDHGDLPSPPSIAQMSTWGSRWGRLGLEKDYFSLSFLPPKMKGKKKKSGYAPNVC